MIPESLVRAQLPHTLRQIDLPGLGELYRGKVRDNYSRGDRIVMITTDAARTPTPGEAVIGAVGASIILMKVRRVGW